MSIQQWIFGSCLALAATGAALAQPAAPAVNLVSPATAPLTLAQVLQASRQNVEVSLAQRALAAARADVASADHAPAPVLSAKAASMDLQNGLGGGNVWRDKRIDKGLGLDWTWERGNKRVLRTRAAEQAALAAQADAEEAVVQQQTLAASAFYDLLAAQERVTQLQDMARSAADLRRSAQRRLSVGDVSQQEALRIAIEAERTHADWQAALNERSRAELVLAQATQLTGPLSAHAAWPAVGQAVSPALSDEQRPDLRAARLRMNAAQAAQEGAQALRQRDVTLGTSFDHVPGTSTRLLELRVQMPLTGVMGNYGYEGEQARATAQLQLAQDLLDKTLLTVQLGNRRLQQELQAATERAQRYQSAIVPQARQVLAMAEQAYLKGAMSLSELLEARRTLRTALLEDVAARADHARTLAAWQLRCGAAL